MNKCRRLPGRVGIGSWSERGHGSTRSLFVAPCAGVLGRIPSALSGKTPAWEQSGGKKHKGAAASWSDSIPVCVDLTELLQGLEYFGFIVVRIVY